VNDYDQAARYAARRVDEFGFLRWVLGTAVIDAWEWKGWLDTQAVPFPGEPDRRCDTVAAFERKDGTAPPVAAIIEFMSEPRSDFPERLADYCLVVRRAVLYAAGTPTVRYRVVGIVLNLTGATQPDFWEMAPSDFGGLGLQFRFGVRTLREQNAEKTLAAIERSEFALCVLAWIPLMDGADRPEVVAQWRRLAGLIGRPERRAEFAGLALIFAELAGCRPVWEKGLEDFNVLQSQIMQEVRAKGRAEGEARASRSALVRYLRKRYPDVPADLIALVEAQTDPELLARWFDAALDAVSLDAVRAAFTTS
jgi:hypothetical protein